jgi:hypothetical protein
MLPALMSNSYYYYVVLAVMLPAILFGYFKGREVASASGRSLAWTSAPLIALAIVSIGPSAFAIMIYLAYEIGLIQPPADGDRFSIFIRGLPFDFAIMNWGFVALYVACRLRPNRFAMWLSAVAMSIPNVVLFGLAWEMVSNARDAGQCIGVIEATLGFPLVALILPNILEAGDGIVSVISALTAPMPILGLTGWLAGIGWRA